LTGRIAGDTVTRLRGETDEGPPRDRCDKPRMNGLLTAARDAGRAHRSADTSLTP
jgi:hypothetical protein